MPIGVVLVLLYDPEQPLGFVLLSLTYLLINFVFARLSRARARARGARARSRDPERHRAPAVRRRCSSRSSSRRSRARPVKAIPEAEAVALVHRRAGGESELVIDGFDRTSDKFFRQPMEEGEGAAGWVMKHGTPRRIDDLDRPPMSRRDGARHARRGSACRCSCTASARA